MVKASGVARTRPLAVTWSDFSFSYPGEDSSALANISLEIEAGERVVVMGASGCGKSTLGLTLNGLVPRVTGGVSHGEVAVGEVNPAKLPLATIASMVGLVFQDPDSQLCTINTRDEIAFGLQNILVEREDILRRIEETADLVGLRDRLDDPVFNLSGGQKQRVAIASTLVMRPGVLVLDEPTANLDPSGQLEVMRVLTSTLRDHDLTSLVIEHQPGELLRDADRFVVMAEAGIVAHGYPRDVIQRGGKQLEKLGVRLPPAADFCVSMSTDDIALSPDEIDFDSLAGPVRDAHPTPRVQYRDRSAGEVPVLDIQGVRFAYDGKREVLKGVTLQLFEGETVALLGANGSGKTTLASLLVGLNRPTSGQVLVGSENIASLPIREIAKSIGYVFQYPEHQFVTEQVLNEVVFSLKRLGGAEDNAEDVAMTQLEAFDLAHLATKHPFRLSMGEKRRLSIAAMEVYQPKLLLLDEPTFGQDQAHTRDLAKIIRRGKTQGNSVMLITHDLRLTAELADRAVVLEDGEVVFDDSPIRLLELLHQGPLWSLSPIAEYTIWHELAQRLPDAEFSIQPPVLASMLKRAPQ